MKYMRLSLILTCALGCAMLSSQPADVLPGLYEHFRGGRYRVLGVARFSEDPRKEFVIYQQLYESKLEPEGKPLPIGTLWARPKEMFVELVAGPDGKLVSRFKKINEEVLVHEEL